MAPLFDRLRRVKSPVESQPLRALDRRELRASVRHELERLLNTRSTTTAARFATADLTVVNYGLPDTTAFSPWSNEDQQRLAILVTRAVTAFEPRLRDVTASVALILEYPQALLVTLRATLLDEPVIMAVSKPLRNGDRVYVDVQALPEDDVHLTTPQ